VSVSVTPDTETVTVEVTDNGPGIPDDDIEGLFDPVPTQRADHGLGLTIVARLVERYDGTIELVDTGPHGSTFAVTLPRRDADAGSTSDAPQREDGDLPAQTP
jgi:signal transduction histidine kinase